MTPDAIRRLMERRWVIQFQPWEPTSADPRFRGVRLLLLGESHYEEPDEGVLETAGPFPELTREVVDRWGRRGEKRQLFFANIFTLLTGQPWSMAADHATVWDHVHFYNYVQTLVPNGPRNRPTNKMYASSEGAFRDVLERIRPEATIVLGEQLWQAMATEDRRIGDFPDQLGLSCGYILRDGAEVFTAHTRHPSSPGFSALKWAPRVERFLDWCNRSRSATRQT